MLKYSASKYYFILFLILYTNALAIGSSTEKKNLLLISSYNPNFPTFFQQIAGLRSQLPPKKFNFDVEFMDSKRFPGLKEENRFFQYLAAKINKLPPYDLIFTADDNALNFITKHHKRLFPGIPIVFFGVNNLQNARQQEQNDFITGVIEAPSIKETITLARDIIPDLREIYAIYDSTTSSTADIKSFMALQKEFSKLKLQSLSLKDLAWSELANNVKHLPPQSCLLLLSAHRDKNNIAKRFPDSLDLLIANSSVPVFHLWEYGLGDGIIGGKVVSHFEQGREAGIIANKILIADRINGISVETKSPNKVIIDYKVLKKFGLEQDRLPDGVKFINKPASIFAIENKFIYLIGFSFIIMSIFIFILIINIQRRKSIEKRLRKSEQTFKTLFNESSHFIGLLSMDYKLIRANAPALHAVGLSEADVCKQYFWDTPWWIGTGFEKKLETSLKKAAKGEKIRFIATHNFYDGREIIIDFSAKPVYNEENTVTEILVEGLDITEFRRIEEQLKHVEKMNSIGTLAGGLAHDFNNMLGGIIGCAELLHKQFKDKKDAESLITIIIETAEKASKLIKNLLAFSRKQQLFPSTIDVHKVIADSIMLLKHTVDKRIQIHSHLEAETSTVLGDQSQLQNVFLNLGINSWHAMPAGGELTFSSELTEFDPAYCNASPFKLTPGTYLKIDVKDNGNGIEPKHLNHIFDPFFTTRKQGEGTGLGLSAAYGTIIQHMGAITIDSEPGEGSTFHLYLPITTEEAKETDISGQSNSSLNGKILLADDDDIMRFTAKRIIESSGCSITVAHNGKEALRIFSENPEAFDIVILDMVMPEMNGLDCFKAIKNIKADICIIISSGYTADSYIKELNTNDLFGAIDKPYRAQELREIISQALDYKNKQSSSRNE